LLNEGAMTQEAWTLSALALAPTLVGMVIGQKLRGRVPEAKFRTGVYLVLIVLAANLIRKGFM